MGGKKKFSKASRHREAGAGDGSSSSSSSSGPTPMQRASIDLNRIEANIQYLNDVSEREAKIVRGPGGIAKFDIADREVKIYFYSNGLRVGDQLFFLYENQSAQRTLRDILDGYFPYCLKDDYPEGVKLK